MIEILRTNDPVRLSYALALLADAGCRCFVADQHISAVEGGISAFPRRVLVPSAWEAIARKALAALDEPTELPESADGDEPDDR